MSAFLLDIAQKRNFHVVVGARHEKRMDIGIVETLLLGANFGGKLTPHIVADVGKLSFGIKPLAAFHHLYLQRTQPASGKTDMLPRFVGRHTFKL